MSHVISAQPSATSPYQPTAMQEGNSDNPPRIHRIDSEQGQDDCCIHTRNKKGCCLFVCTLLSMCCQGIKNCTESCCDCCANCLIDCCEDKPRERNQRIYTKRYKNTGGNYYDNTTDNNDDWGINSLSDQHLHVGVGSHAIEPAQDMTNSNDKYNSSTHRINSQDLGTHHSSGHHDSGKHHSSGHHDSGMHQSSGHHASGTHHSSSHTDSGTHHTSSHDTCHSSGDGGGFDSGGGCDSGGGDTGGGGDSGGGCDD